MATSFSIPCNFNGKQNPVTLFIGEPNPDKHPLNFQANWLSSSKGGQIPADIMESIQNLYDLAKRNNVLFEDLCGYAINVANGSIKNDNEKFNLLLGSDKKIS